MLQLEHVIFSEGLLKIPPVLQARVTQDVLNVAASYYSYQIKARYSRHSRQLGMISNSLKLIDAQKEEELYAATRKWFEATKDILYALEDNKERILDAVSTNEYTDFENHIKDGYFVLRYPLTEELFQGWYPGGKEMSVDLKNILTPTQYQKENNSAPTLVCFIEFLMKHQKASYDGLYREASSLGVYMINIPLPVVENIEERDTDLEGVVDSLPTTVEHELGHFVQELLQIAKTNVPHREKRYRLFGYPSKKIQQNKAEYTANNSGWADPHSLRDIEFYTRLADAKTRLIGGLENRLTNWNLERFKAFVGTSQDNETFGEVDLWFKILAKEAPGKYKKAVAELYKTVRGQYFS